MFWLVLPFKKLRLFVNEQNLKIDVVLKASHAIVIRWFSLNEAPLGLFKFISDYLPYFEKVNIFFNIITKKFEFIYKDWSKLFVWFIWIISIRLYTPLRNTLCELHCVYNLLIKANKTEYPCPYRQKNDLFWITTKFSLRIFRDF